MEFEKFLNENTPAPIQVPWERFTSILKDAGIKEQHGVFRDAEGNSFAFPNQECKIIYHPELEGDTIRFVPRLKTGGVTLTSRDLSGEVISLLEQYAPEVNIPLPERVVEMPIPGWVEATSDDGWAYLSSEKKFISEAIEAFEYFEQRFREKLLE